MDTREANRLTESDELQIIAAVRRAIRTWDEQSPLDRASIGAADREALRRIAAHSIGCSLYDLRDSEIAWVDEIIAEQVAR